MTRVVGVVWCVPVAVERRQQPRRRLGVGHEQGDAERAARRDGREAVPESFEEAAAAVGEVLHELRVVDQPLLQLVEALVLQGRLGVGRQLGPEQREAGGGQHQRRRPGGHGEADRHAELVVEDLPRPGDQLVGQLGGPDGDPDRDRVGLPDDRRHQDAVGPARRGEHGGLRLGERDRREQRRLEQVGVEQHVCRCVRPSPASARPRCRSRRPGPARGRRRPSSRATRPSPSVIGGSPVTGRP